MTKRMMVCGVVALMSAAGSALAGPVTDPNDARSWQGATVGTFAQLYYGSDTPVTRQQVVDNLLLDDGTFNPASYVTATLVSTPWALANATSVGQSLDQTGTGSYGYNIIGNNPAVGANAIDDLWFQSSGTVGDSVFDLGFDAQYAAVFVAIDHGPLPYEAIESTVYLSNDQATWTQAEVVRVWLEGYHPNTGVLWDGFVYSVQPIGGGTFRYASIIHGGPGALQSDGDDEINGLMGLPGVPAPGGVALLACGAVLMGRRRR